MWDESLIVPSRASRKPMGKHKGPKGLTYRRSFHLLINLLRNQTVIVSILHSSNALCTANKQTKNEALK